MATRSIEEDREFIKSHGYGKLLEMQDNHMAELRTRLEAVVVAVRSAGVTADEINIQSLKGNQNVTT